MQYSTAELRQLLAEALRLTRSLRDEVIEQRMRRLAIEEEIDEEGFNFLHRPIIIRYVERKMYKPMPSQEVVRRIYVPQLVERIVERTVPVEHIVGRLVVRPVGFFGRIGVRIDRFIAGWSSGSSSGS